MFFAAQGGFLDIVKVLLDSGAPVDLPSYVSCMLIVNLFPIVLFLVIKLGQSTGTSDFVNNCTILEVLKL